MQTQMANQNSQTATAPIPRFVVTLAAESSAQELIRVPLAITGKWMRGMTAFAITRADLESIVRNFRGRQNGEINVDYDHASEMPEVAAGGPVPSAGRIVRLDAPELASSPGPPPLSPLLSKEGSAMSAASPPLNQKGRTNRSASPLLDKEGGPEGGVVSDSRYILYGWFEPTVRARELLRNREYRFISPAIEWSARNKRTGKSQGTTLTSVALTNRPFLEELPQIRLSDPEFLPVYESGRGDPAGGPISGEAAARPNETGGRPPHSKGGSMKHVNLSAEGGRIHIQHEDLQGEFYFVADDLAAVGARHGVPLQDGSNSAALSESAVVSFAQASTLLSEADARGKYIPASEVFRASAERELEDAVRTGKVLPRQRDDWRKIALSDLPTFRKLMSVQKPVVPLGPVGLAGTPPGDVQEQIKFLAEQRMRERQITFGQALGDIGREQPDLMQQYRRAVSNND